MFLRHTWSYKSLYTVWIFWKRSIRISFAHKCFSRATHQSRTRQSHPSHCPLHQMSASTLVSSRRVPAALGNILKEQIIRLLYGGMHMCSIRYCLQRMKRMVCWCWKSEGSVDRRWHHATECCWHYSWLHGVDLPRCNWVVATRIRRGWRSW